MQTKGISCEEERLSYRQLIRPAPVHRRCCRKWLFRAIGHILPLYTKNGRKCGYLVHQATLYIRTFCLSRQLHGTARPVMVAGGGPGGGPACTRLRPRPWPPAGVYQQPAGEGGHRGGCDRYHRPGGGLRWWRPEMTDNTQPGRTSPTCLFPRSGKFT